MSVSPTGWFGRSAWRPFRGAAFTWNPNVAGGRSGSPSPKRWRRSGGPPVGSSGSSPLPDVSRLSEPLQHEPIRALERVRLCRQPRPLPRLQGGRCPALPLYRMLQPGSRPGRSRGSHGDRPGGAEKSRSRVRLPELRRAFQRTEGPDAGGLSELWADLPRDGRPLERNDLANDLRQDLTGLAVDNHGGEVVERGGLRVDDAEICAVLEGHSWNPRSGIDLQRATHDQDDISGHRHRLGIAQRRQWQRLPEKDDGRFEEAPTAGRAARRTVLAVHPVRLVARQAGLTRQAYDFVR